MKAEYIINKARQSISGFCIKECKAYCCRTCYLILKESQLDTVTQGRREELVKEGVLFHMNDGRWSMNMGLTDKPCPSLDMKEYKCTIHKSRKRASTCREFPIFVDGLTIKLSPRCLAVKNGMLYPYIKQLLMLGYTLAEAEQYSDTDLYKITLDKNDDCAGKAEIKT